ncbi:MAG: cobyric acid synthase, partial [Methanobacteriota archaeon]
YYRTFAKEKGMEAVRAAIERLKGEYDLLVMEGAGSPAEINLYERDISNFAAAEIAGADVVLVADIERGGVFASIYGTLELLKPVHRRMVKGVIINKFRGDEELLRPAVEKIQRLTGVPVIGVVPYMEGLRLPDEDSQSLSEARGQRIDIAVIRLPRISNFTDFDPLAYDRRVALRYVGAPEELGSPDAIILPGTKSTIDDLLWLRERGFEDAIRERAGRIPIIGICGGFQILGRRIIDDGVEKDGPSVHEGLGLLDVETTFEGYRKTTRQVSGVVAADRGVFEGMKGAPVSGYEIHMGETRLLEGARPVFTINGADEGAADRGFMTFGTYLHGLFDSPSFREGLIDLLSKNTPPQAGAAGGEISRVWEESIERMAKTVKSCVDLSWFL